MREHYEMASPKDQFSCIRIQKVRNHTKLRREWAHAPVFFFSPSSLVAQASSYMKNIANQIFLKILLRFPFSTSRFYFRAHESRFISYEPSNTWKNRSSVELLITYTDPLRVRQPGMQGPKAIELPLLRRNVSVHVSQFLLQNWGVVILLRASRHEWPRWPKNTSSETICFTPSDWSAGAIWIA